LAAKKKGLSKWSMARLATLSALGQSMLHLEMGCACFGGTPVNPKSMIQSNIYRGARLREMPDPSAILSRQDQDYLIIRIGFVL